MTLCQTVKINFIELCVLIARYLLSFADFEPILQMFCQNVYTSRFIIAKIKINDVIY